MREITLEATPHLTEVAGQQVQMLTYNGQFPGPPLRLVEGEHICLRLRNRLGQPTNLHLHGLPIPPDVDDPRILVNDGETFEYRFRVLEGSAGTYWYHPHGHGSVGPQLFAGLAGPLIVEPREQPPLLLDLQEHTLILKDLSITEGHPSPHTPADWLNGKEGDLVLVNGAVTPRIETSRSAVRLRIVNASNARYFHLRISGALMEYLGAGCGFAETTQSVESLLLPPAREPTFLSTFRRPATTQCWLFLTIAEPI